MLDSRERVKRIKLLKYLDILIFTDTMSVKDTSNESSDSTGIRDRGPSDLYRSKIAPDGEPNQEDNQR